MFTSLRASVAYLSKPKSNAEGRKSSFGRLSSLNGTLRQAYENEKVRKKKKNSAMSWLERQADQLKKKKEKNVTMTRRNKPK